MCPSRARPSVPAISVRRPEPPDSDTLRESSRGLRLLVREAAARVRQARQERATVPATRVLGQGNGELFSASRY